ncbi:hypothetical protein [Aliivibrio logei]|uniref:Uncharacterized protein n=1 Tax=Aliivibrio logei TaxID=688 RepID=A0A1B9P0Q6_ALILO|nr:hypothetical protein [Aliivibrio logei]OCH21885.1 hypothetical protein A6E04_08475 [Aliivibrio logei]
MNSNKTKYILAMVISFTLAGCGNESADKPRKPTAPTLPPIDSSKPIIGDFKNIIVPNLEELAGLSGTELISGIEKQLNSDLTAKSGQFKIIPKWGMGGANAWDVTNLNVVQNGDKYVLETKIDKGVMGAPSSSNAVANGFSLLIELPNGLVKEASMSYQFKLSTSLGFGSLSKSPDYIFLGGFTSGDPLVENKPSAEGVGFTYKFSTDRYGYLNTRFMDGNKDLFNQQFQKLNKPLKANNQTWNIVQLNIKTNDFFAGVPLDNGSIVVLHDTVQIAPKAGSFNDRTLINSTHNYKLATLFEFYRHYKHGADQDSDLQEQVIQIKDLAIAWNDEIVTLPDVPVEPTPVNACTEKGFNQARNLDLSKLKGLTGQALIDGIAKQIGDNNGLPSDYDTNRNNMAVVDFGGELALEVTYMAGQGSVNDAENGSSLKVPFPMPDTSLSGACIAYDVFLDKDSSTNNDLIFLPNITLNNGMNMLSDHRYSTSKYKRFSAKFNNPPHKDLGWLDIGKSYTSKGTWHPTIQTLLFDEEGLGNIDYILSGNTYFKTDPNKFGGEAFNVVQHQIVEPEFLDTVSFTANFDSYRHTVGGKENQIIRFKNIAIGWK